MPRADDVAPEHQLLPLDAVELARPARLASVIKILASAAYLLALFTIADRYPMLFAGIVLVPLAALTVVRHLRALTLRSRLRADAHGLTVEAWAARFLVPWLFVETRTIAWDDFGGATVDTLRVNGIERASLVLRFTGGSIEIEPGVFAESAAQLQRRVLDHHARRLPPPDRRDEATIRARLPEPIIVRSRYTLVPATLALGLAALVLAVAAMLELPWFLQVSLAALPLMFAFGMATRFVGERRVRHIELRADGLAIGASPTRLQQIAWNDILYAQLVTTNAVAHALRIVTRDGGEVVLRGKYNYALAELRELIDPAPATPRITASPPRSIAPPEARMP